ncbi:MAG: menaquinone biosynthesis decarboxylase [Gaiellales bacterium]|nr:menaquinone biosynthesis decarboxylase [Gaiellales bacterium]
MRDLRDFIHILRERGELAVIERSVDPVLEISEVTDRVSKRGGPALLFTHPRGSGFPVLTNQFGSEKRMALALRQDSLDGLGERVAEVMAFEFPQGWGDKMRSLFRLRELAAFAPKMVKEAPCRDVVMTGSDVDLGRLPILTCWPQDGGPFITLPLVFTRDPLSGRRNAGMYRLQVYDAATTGMHWHIHKDAAEHFRREASRLQVAVAIGTDPAVTYAATAPLPAFLDEMMFAGFLRGQAVEMVRCLTVDLEVPADAEFVLEGYVDVGERRLEGPFGDHTGFYSAADLYPIFHLTALTHRRDAIYAATVVGPPPMEDAFLGKATERLFLPLLRMLMPEVVDMDLPVAGAFHNCAIISVRKAYPLHARKVMHAVWGMGQMQFSKYVIVVDADVDVHDYQRVAWLALANTDPRRDVVVVDGPLDVLDHSSPTANWGAKMGIDATRTWPEEGAGREWPQVAAMDAETVRRVDAMWADLGLGA